MIDFIKIKAAGFLVLAFSVLFFSCAEQPETQQKAMPEKAELKAKIVYYAIPG
jgi:hypothetical protein